MNKAYFPRPHKKMDGSTVNNNNSSAPFATTGPIIEAKRDPQVNQVYNWLRKLVLQLTRLLLLKIGNVRLL
jgi:hypothetical protein